MQKHWQSDQMLSLPQVGHSCNFWENYESDLQRNVNMGCTSMRFSLEWHRIEPQRGQISSDAIAHYHQILNVMDRCVPETLRSTYHEFAYVSCLHAASMPATAFTIC